MSFDKPSGIENYLATREQRYLKVLEEIENALSMDEAGLLAYIEGRIALLSTNATAGEMSHMAHSVHSGFIGPKMEIRRSFLVDPIVLDDIDLYKDLFVMIKKFKSAPGYETIALREIIPNAIQYTLSKYFGNVTASSSTEMRNREFYMEHSHSESLPISLSEFKGKRMAVCAEKGPAAQNLLAFVGLESDLIASSGCRIPAESEEEAHYFILLHGPKGEAIYDPTNPKLAIDKEDSISSYGVAMYPVSLEQAQGLLAGAPIQVEHEDYKINEDGKKDSDKSVRIYSGPKKYN